MGKLGVFFFGTKTAKGVSNVGKVGLFGGALRKGGALRFAKGSKFRPIKGTSTELAGMLSKGKTLPKGSGKVMGQGDTLDDAFKGMGVKAFNKGGYPIPKGHLIVDANNKIIAIGGKSTATMSTKWTKGMKVVKISSKSSNAAKTAKMVKLRQLAKSSGLKVPGVGTTFRFGFLVTAGYGFYRVISIMGSVSDKAEEVINNFYGIDCEEGDVVCEERGAKNILLSGVLGLAVVGGIIYVVAKPKGKSGKQEVEIKISKDEAVTTA
tara:strand:- start:4 stop:798 length:795 start_codon:yes stop_codon:yes gene_type:complete